MGMTALPYCLYLNIYPCFPPLVLGNMLSLAAVSWRSVKGAVTLAQSGKCNECTNGLLQASLQPFLLLLQISDPITLWDQAVESFCSSLSLSACQTVAEMSCHVPLVLPVRKLPRVLGQCYWPAALLQKRWQETKSKNSDGHGCGWESLQADISFVRNGDRASASGAKAWEGLKRDQYVSFW